MSISLKRVRAIFVKDYKEFSRNYAISIMLIFPIIFAVFIRGNDWPTSAVLDFVFNFSFPMLASFIQASLIAEEKERNTLRSLMMTPATTMDVLIGKSALVFVMSSVVLAFTTYLIGYEPPSIWAFVIAVLLSIILYSAAGTICGLYSKTVLEASLSIFPIFIIFTAAPFAALLEDRYPFLKVLAYAPSSQFSLLMKTLDTSYAIGDVMRPLLLILAWTVALKVVSVVLYIKRLKDE